MTYNVRYFGHGTRGVMSTRRGLERVARTIASLDPLCDIVCLQEVEARSLRSSLVTWGGSLFSAAVPDTRGLRRRTQLQALMVELDRALDQRGVRERYHAHYFAAHRYRLTEGTDLYTTGLAILVRPRLEVVAHNGGRVQDITHRRGAKRLKQTRICAHVTIRVPGHGASSAEGDLDVFNTHMSLPGPFYPEFWTGEARLGFGPNQLAEAKRLVEAVKHHRRSERAVLVGDFNSLPGSPVDRLLCEEGELVDALAITKGMSDEHRLNWSTAGFMRARMAIDRIYASPTIEWLDFDGTAPFDAGTPFAGLSDHVPILGRLQIA
jgi:endonuclease/exonuclease/phosphatase family metal-dependent hydrolase